MYLIIMYTKEYTTTNNNNNMYRLLYYYELICKEITFLVHYVLLNYYINSYS